MTNWFVTTVSKESYDMTWKGKGLTHIGKVRQLNQDAFGIYDHLRLWLIADGMGGHPGGEIASQLAIENMAAYFEKHQPPLDATQTESKNSPVILEKTLEAANRAIRDYARQHVEFTDMGTTAVAVHLDDSSPTVATIAHAGDSRAYLIRDQTLTPLTRDHSLVEEQVELGIITPEQALTHPLRHIITRALGIDHNVVPSVTMIDLTEKDQLLLCTDGLTKMMTDQQILDRILGANTTLDRVCHSLIQEALNRGGEDNVTVVILGVEREPNNVL
ncbi:MAG: Stp1/IreP family PP2C-type Ser/Thr phosphatase [Nitrospirales bacterium]|nr:Stp1/IreP family PP2C-type Ser/Thr phosphatase [Nitrospirales bacterium]